MNSERISVLIPMYNTEDYIEECLRSVAGQTYPDFECVIVDDGSSDLSLQRADAFAQKDHRFRIIRQEHAGVAQAIVNGIENAKGQWLYFLDSDDWIDPDELQYLYTLVTENRCDMIASDYLIETDHPESCSIVRFQGVVEKAGFSRLFYPQFLCNDRYTGIVCGNTRGGKLVRKTLAQNNMVLQKDMRFAEDAILMLGILCDCDRVYGAQDHAGYHYRKHHNSSMHNYGISYAAHRAVYAQRIRELYREKGIDGEPLLERNYLQFELYNILGSMFDIGFDMKALERQYPEIGIQMMETVEKLSRTDKRMFSLRNNLILWMLKHRLYPVLTVLYKVNHWLRYTLKLSR